MQPAEMLGVRSSAREAWTMAPMRTQSDGMTVAIFPEPDRLSVR